MAPFKKSGAFLTVLAFITIWTISIESITVIATTDSSPINNDVGADPDTDPEFTDIIENITVPAGRNVKLACSVKNLGTYKVAWMHFEQSAILTVHNHVITRNPRISVTHDKHDKHKTWFLHINNVQEEDKGRYMCQINTVTAKTQYGYLHVVVPPNIDDALTSTDIIAREGANVTMKCRATGSPDPSIKWKRDDNKRISISKELSVIEWEGEVLELKRISRLDMGAYLCIATNGVPPSVSKRISLSVDFAPMVMVAHQLVGAPESYNATLECIVEAYPVSLNYWSRAKNITINDSSKYKTETVQGSPLYMAIMRLTIIDIQPIDYGYYQCIAKNSLGETDGKIRLYSSSPPTTIPPSTTTTPIPPTSPKKIHKEYQLNNKQNKQQTNSSYGQSANAIPRVEKGTRYQSNLNDINKSEQKLTVDSSKGHDWTKSDESNRHNGQDKCEQIDQIIIAIGLFTCITMNKLINSICQLY